jgi:SAM-dependent methyltransferase
VSRQRDGGSVRPGHRLPGIEPVSRNFGMDRGKSVDRAYIHEFLWERRDDVQGRVLEIADSGYTDYLGEGAVTQVDVLHATEKAPWVTLVGDLATGEGIPRRAFDCIVLTQTLQYVYDLPAAARTLRDALRPGGVVLATLPGVSQVSHYDRERWGDYWRFTSDSARRLFGDAFGEDSVEVVAYGNVLVSAALLYGYALEELDAAEVAHRDPDYEFLIGVRAVRRP